MGGAGAIARIGGHLALDFANTAGWHASEERKEWLTSYQEWLAWVRTSAILPGTVTTRLLQEARRHPVQAARALDRAIEMREVVYRLLTAVAHSRPPHLGDLERLHRARLAALESAEPRWGRDGLALAWPDAGSDLESPLHPLVLAASDLLTQPLDRLRQCGNNPCGWLFLDRSKNGSRRWCSSEECGNATRVRRFRARQGDG